MADLSRYSRFKTTPLVVYRGKLTHGRWQKPAFLTEPLADDDVGAFVVTSSTEGRPDLIAHAVYGIADLWWVIVSYNQATNVLVWPKAGAVIKYPLESIVLPGLL